MTVWARIPPHVEQLVEMMQPTSFAAPLLRMSARAMVKMNFAPEAFEGGAESLRFADGARSMSCHSRGAATVSLSWIIRGVVRTVIICFWRASPVVARPGIPR